MSIKVECECGKTLLAGDGSGGKRVKCPECHALVRVPVPKVESDVEVVEDDPPEAPRPKKKPLRAAATADDEEEPRAKKKARRKKRLADDDEDAEDTSPFWRTRAGLILNGLGLMGLGVGGIAFYWFDVKRPTGLLIAGILCIGFGIGGVITGLTKPAGGSGSIRQRLDDDEE